MIVRMIVEVVGEVVVQALGEFFKWIVSYEGERFVVRGTRSRSEALEALREAAAKPAIIWPRSRGEHFLVGKVEDEGIRLGVGKLWGPVFRGSLESRKDGCVIRGRWTLGNLARGIFAMLGIGLVVATALVLMAAQSALLLWGSLSVSVVLLLVASTSISKNKRVLLPAIQDHLKTCISAPASSDVTSP